MKAEVGFSFVGCDSQDWALSEDVSFTVTSDPSEGGGSRGGGGCNTGYTLLALLELLPLGFRMKK